jgi:hypothetical protein
MLLCSVHSRLYVPALQRWLPVDPVQMQGISSVIPIPEGTCDECLATAKACMLAQFPELFGHENLTPSAPSPSNERAVANIGGALTIFGLKGEKRSPR